MFQVNGNRYLICFLFCLLLASSSWAESVKVKVPFDSANSLIGTLGKGSIVDNNAREIPLKGLTKYKLTFNAKGEYDLHIIHKGKPHYKASLELPITISDQERKGIYLGKKWYAGQVTIKKSITGIIAVNRVEIDDLLKSIISVLTTEDTSREAIKAGVVMYRTSFKCLLSQSKGDQLLLDYDLNSEYLDYSGLSQVRPGIVKLTDLTEGEMLVDAHGKLTCTPLRTAVTEGSYPFELIGYRNNAWERSFTFPELKNLLNYSGYNIEDIYNITKREIAAESKIIIEIETTQDTLQLSPSEAKELLGLPSEFFQLYSYEDRGDLRIQLIGSLAGHKAEQSFSSVLNLIDNLEDERSYIGQDYESLLKDLYPLSYMARF